MYGSFLHSVNVNQSTLKSYRQASLKFLRWNRVNDSRPTNIFPSIVNYIITVVIFFMLTRVAVSYSSFYTLFTG